MAEAIRRNIDTVTILTLSLFTLLFLFFYNSPLIKIYREHNAEFGTAQSVKPPVAPVGAKQITSSLPVKEQSVAIPQQPPKRISSASKSKPLFIEHKILPGESIWSLSKKYNLPTETIYGCNPGHKFRYLHPGRTIKIPTTPGTLYKIARRDTLSKISKIFRVPVSQILKYNKNISKRRLSVGMQIFIPGALPIYKTPRRAFIMPINTWVTSPYGPRYSSILKRREFHPGIDFAGRVGDRVRAAAGGQVSAVGLIKGYGLIVAIKHNKKYTTRYAHLHKAYVRPNQRVYQGQYIGEVGNTGMSTGAHLHFELRRYGYAINPAKMLGLAQ